MGSSTLAPDRTPCLVISVWFEFKPNLNNGCISYILMHLYKYFSKASMNYSAHVMKS